MEPLRPPGHTLELLDRARPTGPGQAPGSDLPPARGVLRRASTWVSLGAVAALAAAGFHATTGDSPALTEHTVVFEVTGSDATAALTWSTSSSADVTHLAAAAVPFRQEITGRAVVTSATITAAVPAGAPAASTVTCRITVDGTLVATNTSSGVGASASCTGYGSDAATS